MAPELAIDALHLLSKGSLVLDPMTGSAAALALAGCSTTSTGAANAKGIHAVAKIGRAHV